MTGKKETFAMKLKGKVAIVTASTAGIGFAVAKKLAEDGAHVVVSSRKQKNVDRAVESLKALGLSVTGLVCHVGKVEHRRNLIEKAVSEFGGIDILVSNAAVNPTHGPILDITESVWDKVFDTNLKSTFFLCKEVILFMEKRGGGCIILVSSLGGYHPDKFMGPYGVSKTAMLGLVKAMAPQCGQKNIRINGIAPGLIKTNFSSVIVNDPKLSEITLKNTPLNRLGEPEDCAGAASFLASDESRFITGETLVVAGGAPSRL